MKPINYKALGAKIKEYRKKENNNTGTTCRDGRYFIKSYVKCGDGFSKRFAAST